MVLDASLLSTKHYKVRTDGKWSNSGIGVAPPPLHLVVVAIKKGAFRSPSTTVGQHIYIHTHPHEEDVTQANFNSRVKQV